MRVNQSLGPSLETSVMCYLLGRQFEARGLLPAHGINPSMGPPLETSCFKGSWKETPYSELACATLKVSIIRTMEQVVGTWPAPLNSSSQWIFASLASLADNPALDYFI